MLILFVIFQEGLSGPVTPPSGSALKYYELGHNLMLKCLYMSMIFPTMWYVRPAKPQVSLRIRAVWSESLLVAWVFFDCEATDWTSYGVSKLKRRLHRLVWAYTCQNATLLEITCHGSYRLQELNATSVTRYLIQKTVLTLDFVGRDRYAFFITSPCRCNGLIIATGAQC